MPTYIALFKSTEQGVKEIKEAPGHIEEAFKGISAVGGKMIGFYAVMGEYDYVGIAEFPSDEVQMAFGLSVASQGGVRATTLKAFTKDEFAAIVKKIP